MKATSIEHIDDTVRLMWLAGCFDECGPVVEGFANDLHDFHEYLGDVMAEHVSGDYVSPDIEATPLQMLEAFRRMIDTQIRSVIHE